MTADTFSLSPLDQPQQAELDPSILADNLDAIRAHDADLVDRLANHAMPAAWRPVLGLDDFSTWQTDGGWLGETAAPWTRAESVAQMVTEDQALALSGIGTGAELVRLRTRLSALSAIFVFEDDWDALRAVLATTRIDQELRDARIVLIAGEQPGAALRDRLQQYPGLLPPVRIVTLPDAAPDRLSELRDICEPIGREILAQRTKRLEELRGAPAGNSQGIAIASFGHDPEHAVWVRSLQQAMAARGDIASAVCTDSPLNGHMLGPAEALAAASPKHLLVLGNRPDELPLPADCNEIPWCFAAPEGDAYPCIAAGTPLVSQRANQHPGVETCLDLWWATDEVPVTEAPLGAHWVVVADWLDIEPRQVGIVQPTHRLLWESLQTLARDAIAAKTWPTAENLLERAERRAGVRLEMADLRVRMREIVARNLIPRLLLETILRALNESGTRWIGVGAGWQASPHGQHCAAATLRELSEQAWQERPLGILFAGGTAPVPDLLHAGARGWNLCVLVPDAKQRPVPPAMLEETHYRRITLNDWPPKPDPQTWQDQARRAQAWVRERHTWNQRAAALCSALLSASP